MTRFDTFLTGVLNRATDEARDDGSSTVEAQHVLLAVAAVEEPGTRALLTSVGLDRAGIRAALDREFEQSLGAAGVTLGAAGTPRASRPSRGAPPLGSSVKLALERGLGSVTRKRDLRPAHLLLGIVRAPVGTVPRALALADVDAAALADRIRDSVAATGGRRDGDA